MRGRELRADLLGPQRYDLLNGETGDLLGFDASHRRPEQLLIEWARRQCLVCLNT